MMIKHRLFADSSNSSEIESNTTEDVDIFCGRRVCKVNKIDDLMLLRNIKNEVITTTFFDPQYRGILDKLNFDRTVKK